MFNSWSILERRGTDFQGTWPTLPELLNMSAEAYPEKPCFFTMTPNESFSYRQVQQAVKHVAAFLAEQGIGPGDTVALSGKNSPHWAAAFFGILASGAAAVPLDFQYSTQRIASLSDFAETKAVIADQQILDSLHPSNMLSLALSEVFSLPESSQIPEGPSCDDLACLMFTSGTTGNEKAVMLTHSRYDQKLWTGSKKKAYPSVNINHNINRMGGYAYGEAYRRTRELYRVTAVECVRRDSSRRSEEDAAAGIGA